MPRASTTPKHYYVCLNGVLNGSHKLDCRNEFKTLRLTLSLLRPSKLRDGVFSIRRINIIGDETVAPVPHGGVSTSMATNGRAVKRQSVTVHAMHVCVKVQLCCHAFIIPVLEGGGWQTSLPGRFTSGDRAPCMHCFPR
jgi:hypothetical protein